MWNILGLISNLTAPCEDDGIQRGVDLISGVLTREGVENLDEHENIDAHLRERRTFERIHSLNLSDRNNVHHHQVCFGIEIKVHSHLSLARMFRPHNFSMSLEGLPCYILHHVQITYKSEVPDKLIKTT